MKNPKSIGITALNYVLPKLKLNLSDLQKRKKLISAPSLLSDFGFLNCFINENPENFDDLIINSGKKVLETKDVAKEDIELLLLYTGIGNIINSDKNIGMSSFRYKVTKIHNALKLGNANPLRISEQGCSGLLSTINIGFHYLNSSNKKSILYLAGDMLPTTNKREIMYNLISDASCGFLLQRNSPTNKIINFHQVVNSYYWDTPLREQELLASYFPMAQRVISTTLEESNLSVNDVDWFVPHNVSLRSWKILAKLMNIPEDKIWTNNIVKYGHTISCDHIINLCDMQKWKVLKKGDIVVLFTFGFGATWSCLVIKH